MQPVVNFLNIQFLTDDGEFPSDFLGYNTRNHVMSAAQREFGQFR